MSKYLILLHSRCALSSSPKALAYYYIKYLFFTRSERIQSAILCTG